MLNFLSSSFFVDFGGLVFHHPHNTSILQHKHIHAVGQFAEVNSIFENGCSAFQLTQCVVDFYCAAVVLVVLEVDVAGGGVGEGLKTLREFQFSYAHRCIRSTGLAIRFLVPNHWFRICGNLATMSEKKNLVFIVDDDLSIQTMMDDHLSQNEALTTHVFSSGEACL